ncbi:MAG: restriction endonuclease subunit S [Undibacterium umbellatum]|uniref:restriction endonuclease subunit S n=1 Tax=Undibacterium umbellatum TaxID=2762300 RepID=UPI003BB6D2A3
MEKHLIPAGYKQTEVGVIPEDWSVDTLLNVCEKITDGTHDTPKPTTLGVPFLTAIHVKENKIDFGSCYYLPKSIHDEIYKRCNPQKNDVLMVNIGAGVATTALVIVDYEFSLKNVALLKPNKKKIIGAYLNFYQSYVKNTVYDSLATGGAQAFLSLSQISQLKISLPSCIEEQTAIANALSDVDALIAALEKLINKKSAIKTAAMQQLLTGKKRLPPFDQLNAGYKQTELGEIPGDWKVNDIGHFNPFITSGSRGWADYYSNFGSLFVRITNMRRSSIYLDLNNNKYVSLPVLSAEGKRTELQNDDVLISITADVGISGFVDDSVEKPAYINQHIALVRFRDEEICSKFVSYYLAGESIQKLFRGSTDQGAKAGMNLTAIGAIKIAVPSKPEQIAIANVLADIDKDLETLQQRLHKTQQIKQGMMQELLTGKTRLVKPQGAPNA